MLAGGLSAGFMGFEGCTYVECGGKAQPLWGCPLSLGTTQGGIGAAHVPREKLRGGVGVSPDPTTNPRRYQGRRPAPRRKSAGV